MKKIAFITLFLCTLITQIGLGDVPRTISYQGVLTDNSGNPIQGSKSVTFRIFDPSGTDSPWSEDHNVTFDEKGIFNVILGSVNALSLPFDKPYSLEITVDGATLGPIPLTASPYSLSTPTTGGGGDGTSPWSVSGDNIYRLKGKVGIGTSTPDYKLQIKHADTYALTINRKTSDIPALLLGPERIASWNDDLRFGEDEGTVFHQWLTVQRNTDNVGIGTDDPLSPLHIAGNGFAGLRLTNKLVNGPGASRASLGAGRLLAQVGHGRQVPRRQV
jgi:hypothetical protein